eukprot:764368-Hanusia_phi.AAC.3
MSSSFLSHVSYPTNFSSSPEESNFLQKKAKRSWQLDQSSDQVAVVPHLQSKSLHHRRVQKQRQHPLVGILLGGRSIFSKQTDTANSVISTLLPRAHL